MNHGPFGQIFFRTGRGLEPWVSWSAGQAGVVPPGVGRATPRRGRGAAAQLPAGACRVDVQAGGDVLQRAVGLRDELLPGPAVARREDQPVAQRVSGPAAAGVGHAEPGAGTLGRVLEPERTLVRAVAADEASRRVALGGGPSGDDRARALVLPEDVEPVAEPVDLVPGAAAGAAADRVRFDGEVEGALEHGAVGVGGGDHGAGVVAGRSGSAEVGKLGIPGGQPGRQVRFGEAYGVAAL